MLLLVAAGAVLFTAGVLVGRKTAPVSITLERLEASPPEAEEPPAARPPEERTGPLNVNTATREELAALPGAGEKLAEAILAYREENGPFRSVSELLNVKGMTRDLLAALRPLVTVE